MPRGLTGVKPVRGAAAMESEVTPPRRLAAGGVVIPASAPSAWSPMPIGTFSIGVPIFPLDEGKAVATQTGPDNRLRYHAQTVRTLFETKTTAVIHAM